MHTVFPDKPVHITDQISFHAFDKFANNYEKIQAYNYV